MIYGDHPDGGLTEIESCDIVFLKDDYPSIGEVKRDLELYELEEPQDNAPQSPELEVEMQPISETVENSGSTPQDS